MKTNLTICILFLASLLFASSCNKDGYFDDSGVHDPNYNGTMLEYFQNHSKDSTSLFDTLLNVIKIAGLENTIANENITFFAPTDPSIRSAIKELNWQLYAEGKDTISRLDQVDATVWNKFLRGYMIKENKGITDFPQVDTMALNSYGGQLYQTLDQDLTVNIGVVYHDLKNGDVVIKYQGPRQLVISYIPDVSKPLENWQTGYVATSNIAPKNGRLHVIRYLGHSFGFTYRRFANAAIEAGIKYN
ncbi:fasciclin domain-containing protein [Sphingobacterium kyonggiense]|uniref:Fasciclin domain-containing protein n=1 Tax=Sphingobacterium kyonggiense TaxID=714075 RepID=A0ABP7Z0E2_9SPHI